MIMVVKYLDPVALAHRAGKPPAPTRKTKRRVDPPKAKTKARPKRRAKR
jgi:hypothetical protein